MDEDVTGTGSRQTLQGIAEIRHFFRTNETPIYFVGATPFNLLGIDRWVRNFRYVTYYDAWDGEHPHVITPRDKPYIEFSSGEEINNYLLLHPEMRARMGGGPARPKVAMVFFDEETERICDELGYDLVLPPASLRERLDSKIVTTQLGNEAGAPSVPNVLVSVDSWKPSSACRPKPGSAPTSSCRRRTATRERRRSSSLRRMTGRSTPDRFWAKTRR